MDELDFTICPLCEEGYTDSFTSCPNKCGVGTQSRKIAPVANGEHVPVMNTLLSYQSYKDLSPNKVSKQEYTRYLYLFRLQEKGIISGLELQVKYEVIITNFSEASYNLIDSLYLIRFQ